MLKAIWEWIVGLFRHVETTLPEDRQEAEPRKDIQVVEPVAGKDDAGRWYMTAEMRDLLALIRKYEAPAGYNQRFAEAKPKRVLATMTFDEVRAYGRSRVTVDKKASSAIGGYQFITKTLDSLRASLHLRGAELFTTTLQDDLAVALMIRRGLMEYLRGKISTTDFCNNLAKEWASLPVVSSITGAHRKLKSGQSYYAGDGLNAAHHKPAAVVAAVNTMRSATAPRMPNK